MLQKFLRKKTTEEYYNKAVHLSEIINDNLVFDEETSQFTFYKNNAVQEGLDEHSANQLDNYYSNLSKEEAKQANEDIKAENGVQVRSVTISGLLLAAGKILVKAG